MSSKNILKVQNIKQVFNTPIGTPITVLEDINFTLCANEIVGLLGKSGSGKSTILRIVSALTKPTSGMVLLHDKPIEKPDSKISMVFQNFALFPWLTTIENIGIGLRTHNIPPEEITKRSLRAISLIGLDGYENNYPRDLSGGMRQRVGIARALVVNPEILLMDEPFSALDVLTGEVLKTDLLDIWTEESTCLKSILIVTHNIEEAIFLCDKIMVLSSHPGKIISEISIKIPHPRDRLSVEFRKIVDQIYDLMTHNLQDKMRTDSRIIPNVEPMAMQGLMEKLIDNPYNGHANLPKIASSLNLSTDHLFPLIIGLQLMKFVELSEGDINITASGRVHLEGNNDERKEIFGRHLIQYIPLAGYIRRLIRETEKPISSKKLLDELRKDINEEIARNTIQGIIKWGVYGELFTYDTAKQIFKLG
jgi:NitT/TauT family transport system ATP-binding protein